MPYPNDRRRGARDGDEALLPEFLAVLMACGGEVRASDRTSDDGVAYSKPGATLAIQLSGPSATLLAWPSMARQSIATAHRASP